MSLAPYISVYTFVLPFIDYYVLYVAALVVWSFSFFHLFIDEQTKYLKNLKNFD